MSTLYGATVILAALAGAAASFLIAADCFLKMPEAKDSGMVMPDESPEGVCETETRLMDAETEACLKAFPSRKTG